MLENFRCRHALKVEIEQNFFLRNKEESCLSRNQLVLYRKSSPHKPSSYLITKLRSYEELHKRCGPHTKSYNRSIKQLVSGQIDNSTDCRYVVWVAFCGLGNRILSITSAFLYALLTNRSEINSFEQNYNYSYGYMLKSNIINYSTELLPSYMFLYLSHDYDHHDKLFFCDQDEALLSKVPWLIMKSNVYFLPSLFLISSFEQELSKLFPDKETFFHHLGRYLFQPSNLVWRLITQYYQDYLAKAEKRIGIQIRVFDAETSPFEYVMDQILACTQTEKLLPEVDTEKTIAAQSENQTSKAVLITSLFPGYFEKLKNMYGEHPTKNGETVAAWVEMNLLSFSDELVTSAWSTFGYVAQGLGGMRPWILYKINQTKPDPLCGRGMSMEPCYHAPPVYGCKAKTTVDTATLVPHVRHCEDIRWGIKLFNSSS
ncbi:hypothetical protein ACOSP7_032079 [Xanthoceras sorbifolium]